LSGLLTKTPCETIYCLIEYRGEKKSKIDQVEDMKI
jgi:hypothetical protein